MRREWFERNMCVVLSLRSRSIPHAHFLFFSTILSSYFGLVSFWLAREVYHKDKEDSRSRKRDSKRWMTRGSEMKDVIEKLATTASTWNFENSKLLRFLLLFPLFC